jgi:hypothetical protein
MTHPAPSPERIDDGCCALARAAVPMRSLPSAKGGVDP